MEKNNHPTKTRLPHSPRFKHACHVCNHGSPVSGRRHGDSCEMTLLAGGIHRELYPEVDPTKTKFMSD